MWATISEKMTFESAATHCEGLTEGGYDDWRMPTITQLRSLIRNCEGPATGGNCGISAPNQLSVNYRTDKCLCDSIEDNDGFYSKLGDDDNVVLWSNSDVDENSNFAWAVNFSNASINTYSKSDDLNEVRCMRFNY